MDDAVRFGVVGLGTQGTLYARLVSQGRAPALRLAAVCGSNPASRATDRHSALAAELGVPLFTDYTALLESGEVDAVVITTPHYEHPAFAIEALRRGVHTLLEKPAGVYTLQVERMLAAGAENPDATRAMMFNQRANPLYSDLKRAIDSGLFGELRHSSWIITSWWRPDAYYASSPWRATWGGEGGGVLVNQAPHQLDLWQWLCGAPERVFARAQFGFRRDIPVEDEVNAVVDFGHGATGHFMTGTNDLVGTDRLELLFDRGKVLVEGSSRITTWLLNDDERTIARTMSPEDAAKAPSGALDLSTFWSSDSRDYASRWGEQHAAVLQNFGEHILDGTPLLASGLDGLAQVKLANAMHLSAWTGRDVDLAHLDATQYLAELNSRIAAEGRYPTRE